MPRRRWSLMAANCNRPPGSHWEVFAQGAGRGVHTGSDRHPGTIFDELVVDHWLHVEQMDTHDWWINVGGVHMNVTVGVDGHARIVNIDLADPREDTEYRIGGKPWN